METLLIDMVGEEEGQVFVLEPLVVGHELFVIYLEGYVPLFVHFV